MYEGLVEVYRGRGLSDVIGFKWVGGGAGGVDSRYFLRWNVFFLFGCERGMSVGVKLIYI